MKIVVEEIQNKELGKEPIIKSALDIFLENNTGMVLANNPDHRETKVGCLIRRTADG